MSVAPVVPPGSAAAELIPPAPPASSRPSDRFRLQRRSPVRVRQHLLRTLVRVTVLAGADLATIWVVRAVGRSFLRDQTLLSGPAQRAVESVFPLGLLNGWQYAVAVVLSLLVFGAYRPGDPRRDPARLLGAAALGTALALWATIWDRGLPVVFAQYVVLSGTMGLAITLQRLSIDRVTARVFRRRRQPGASRALIIGRQSERESLQASRALSDLIIVGALDPAGGNGNGVRPVQELQQALHELSVETVVVADSVDAEMFGRVSDVAMAAGCELVFAPRGLDLPGVRPQIIWRHGHALVQLTTPGIRGWQLVVKRLMDLAGALLGIIALGWLMLLIGIAVKLDSRGPMLFRQTRVGRGGRRFKIVKFRTMEENAEDRVEDLRPMSVYRDERLFKVRKDPRVTRLGRFLRASSLDELPQLFNVLAGQMSLVGPRPPLPSEVELYEERHFARFDVKPGITGPWQASGRNEITDFEQIIALESDYIRNWSLLSDLVLLARTVPVVLLRHGAF